jgi:hypothetical protein
MVFTNKYIQHQLQNAETMPASRKPFKAAVEDISGESDQDYYTVVG